LAYYTTVNVLVKWIWHFTFFNLGDFIMKNLITALMIVFGFASFSFAGDCGNGVCLAPLQPVRKVVNVTKNIVVAPVRAVGVVVAAPVRAVAAVSAPRNCCVETVATDCGCGCGGSSTTKEVVKYQPLRRRLINRTTTVNCCQ
jgi:hypothetical protein